MRKNEISRGGYQGDLEGALEENGNLVNYDSEAKIDRFVDLFSDQMWTGEKPV